jgi:hypothetical protein
MRNIYEKRIEIDEDGKCETFQEGVSELYNCEWSQDGKCKHCWSNGELDCKGTDAEKAKCMEFNEMS